MLIESSITARLPVHANVGLTAYKVAAVQAKVFVKTLSDVTNRQEQVVDEQARQSEAQRQKIRQQVAESRDGVDVVVESSENVPAENPTSVRNAAPQGNKVDLQI